jgi:hypothetical protein
MTIQNTKPPKEEEGTMLSPKFSRHRIISQSPPSAGLSTPPIWMPEPPLVVVDRDMEYAASERNMESKDWAMWHRLNTNGMKVDSPNRTPTTEPQSVEPRDSSAEDDPFEFEFEF